MFFVLLFDGEMNICQESVRQTIKMFNSIVVSGFQCMNTFYFLRDSCEWKSGQVRYSSKNKNQLVLLCAGLRFIVVSSVRLRITVNIDVWSD